MSSSGSSQDEKAVKVAAIAVGLAAALATAFVVMNGSSGDSVGTSASAARPPSKPSASIHAPAHPAPVSAPASVPAPPAPAPSPAHLSPPRPAHASATASAHASVPATSPTSAMSAMAAAQAASKLPTVAVGEALVTKPTFQVGGKSPVAVVSAESGVRSLAVDSVTLSGATKKIAFHWTLHNASVKMLLLTHIVGGQAKRVANAVLVHSDQDAPLGTDPANVATFVVPILPATPMNPNPVTASTQLILSVIAVGTNGVETTASVTVGIACIRGDVLLKTQRGAVRADSVHGNDAFEQPDGSFAAVTAIRESLISEGTAARDRRLFSDASGKVVVTALHALTSDLSTPLVPACEHPAMLEILDVEDAPPFVVYHFVLHDPKALIGVASSSFWLESFPCRG